MIAAWPGHVPGDLQLFVSACLRNCTCPDESPQKNCPAHLFIGEVHLYPRLAFVKEQVEHFRMAEWDV